MVLGIKWNNVFWAAVIALMACILFETAIAFAHHGGFYISSGWINGEWKTCLHSGISHRALSCW